MKSYWFVDESNCEVSLWKDAWVCRCVRGSPACTHTYIHPYTHTQPQTQTHTNTHTHIEPTHMQTHP